MDSVSFLDALRARYVELSPHIGECGMRIAALGSDGVTLELPSREEWIGDIETGRLSPGIISVLVDSTAGLAVIAHAGQREPIATLDLRIDYLRPAFAGSAVLCRAHCLRMTRSIAFAHAQVWQDDEQTPVATAQLVFMRSAARRQTEPGRGR